MQFYKWCFIFIILMVLAAGSMLPEQALVATTQHITSNTNNEPQDVLLEGHPRDQHNLDFGDGYMGNEMQPATKAGVSPKPGKTTIHYDERNM